MQSGGPSDKSAGSCDASCRSSLGLRGAENGSEGLLRVGERRRNVWNCVQAMGLVWRCPADLRENERESRWPKEDLRQLAVIARVAANIGGRSNAKQSNVEADSANG